MEGLSLWEIVVGISTVVGLLGGVIAIYVYVKEKRETEKKLRPRLGIQSGSGGSDQAVRDALKGYVPPAFTVRDASGAETQVLGGPKAAEDLPAYLIRLIERKDNPPKYIAVLGDAGTGKTALFYRLYQRYQHRRYGGRSKRFYVRYFRVHDFQEEQMRALEQELADKGHAAKEKLLLLLDAFDEDLNNSDRIAARLMELASLTQDRAAAVILSSREQYFETAQEMPDKVLIPAGPGTRKYSDWYRIHLSLFDESRQEAYLRKRFPKGAQRERAMQLAGYMGELAERPLLLSFLPNLVEAGPDLSRESALHLPPVLYREMIRSWLTLEAEQKAGQAGAPEAFLQTSLDFCRDIARAMWQQGANRNLPHDVVEALAKKDGVLAWLSEAAQKRQAKTRSLLIRASDAWTFAHRSFLEYFLALDLWEGRLELVPDSADAFVDEGWKNAPLPDAGFRAAALPGAMDFYNALAWKSLFIDAVTSEGKSLGPTQLTPDPPRPRRDSLPYSARFPRELPRLYEVPDLAPEAQALALLPADVYPREEDAFKRKALARALTLLPDPALRVLLLRFRDSVAETRMTGAWDSLKLLLMSLDPFSAVGFAPLQQSVGFHEEQMPRPEKVQAAQIRIGHYGRIAAYLHAHDRWELNLAELESLGLENPEKRSAKAFALLELDLLKLRSEQAPGGKFDLAKDFLRFPHPLCFKWALIEHWLATGYDRAGDATLFWEPCWQELIARELPAREGMRDWMRLRPDLERGYTGYTDRGWAVSQTHIVPWGARRVLHLFKPRLLDGRGRGIFACGNAWESLSLRVQELSSLAGIGALADSLRSLYLDYNPLATVDELTPLAQLETLSLIGCGLADFPGGGHFARLRRLFLGHNENLRSKPAWAEMSALEELDLAHTALDDLRHLPPGLRKLRISHTALRSLAGIERLTRLEHLEAEGLELDWSPLLACTALHTLLLRQGSRFTTGQLAQLPALAQLFLPEHASAAAQLRPQLSGLGLGAYYEAQGRPAKAPADLKAGMVYVPGGLYRRGSEDCLEMDDGVHTSELPVHLTAIAPFALAETPVTRQAFAKFVADKPVALQIPAEQLGGSLADFVAEQPADLLTTAEELGGSFIFDWRSGYRFAQGIHWRHDAFGEAWETAAMPNEAWEHPVTHVSWYDACRYANWRSQQEGLAPCYRLGEVKVEVNPGVYRTVAGIHGFEDTGGYRLPTEAEWEYAAGWAGPGEQHVFAGTSDSAALGEYAHYGSGQGTAPVKGRKPNALGLYDLSGNVYEWCQQAFGEYGPFLYVDHPDREFWHEGEDGATGVVWMRLWRGGSWISDNFKLLCVAHRNHDNPHNHDGDGGFLLARTLRS